MKNSKIPSILMGMVVVTIALSHADERLVGLPLGGPQSVGPKIDSAKTLSDTIAVQIDNQTPGISLSLENAFGADLAIWNKPERYEVFKPFLIDAGFNWFRFPNGSLSNDYHWNGEGSLDADGIWTTTHKTYKPGFLVEARYRGTSKDNYGFKRASHLTDGVDSSLWWGVVEDSKDPPWFVVDLGQVKSVDSMAVTWGKWRPKSMQLMAWDSVDAPYPGPHQRHQNHWKKVADYRVDGVQTSKKFAPVQARFWAVKADAKQIPAKGMQVGEFRLWSGDSSATRNVNDAGQQSKAWGISTHIGGEIRTDWIDIQWDFEKFMEWVQSVPNGKAVICVNVATGTPAEAASWVYYANKMRGFKIRDWQVGNENDGEWEEGGPLSATQYARRFIAFSKAMKAVDPSIRVFGPLHSTDEWAIKGDGLYSGRAWMETFLMVVGEAERKAKTVYLDGVDFHTYPYWFTSQGQALAMLHASRRPGPMMDTLSSWMNKHLKNGHERRVALSEFSSTVVGTDLTQRAVQATVVVNMFADFISRFGNRGHALPWDVYGSFQTGPDGTSGSLRLFNPVHSWSYSSWGTVAPSSQFHGLYLAQQEWLKSGLKVYPVKISDSTLQAFAVGSGDTTHLLLVNFRETAVTVQAQLKSQNQSPIQVFQFGEDNFYWKGNDDKAYAVPGTGAWSDRRPSSHQTSVRVPPMGLALVQWGSVALADEPVEMLHLAVTRTLLKPGDTLDIWGTARQRDGALIKATYKSPWGPGEIQPMDGQWGGELEGIRLRLPIPTLAKLGSGKIELTVKGTGDQAGAWMLQYRIQGALRTVASLSKFESGSLNSDQPSGVEWFTYAHGNNGTKLDLSVIPGSAPLGGHLQGRFDILQPLNQGWPNFVSAHLPVDRALFTEKKFQHVAGIVFDYATTHSHYNGYFQIMALSEPVKDYDDFVKRLKNTRGSWVRDTILWSDMAQEGWGKPCGALDPALITQLEFQARGAGRGEIRLDNIMLLAEDGQEISMPQSLRRLR